jgi:hypothetical protein
MRRSSSVTTTLVAALLLGACATGPEVAVDPLSDPREARRLLAATAAGGPVPVRWRGEPPLVEAELLAAVERGVRGLSITTTASDTGERGFVFDFAGGDFAGGREPLCGDPAERSTGMSAYLVRGAFCDGARAVAIAGADPAGEPRRLIWRLVGRLVPDDYPDTYGFDLFGNRITLGVGAGF